MPSPAERLIVALDHPDREAALAQAALLGPPCRYFKVGLELFSACGPAIVRELCGRGGRVFLDLKLHDIPETVARAVHAAGRMGAELLTVHAGGGVPMMRRAAQAARAAGVKALAVTVLTSLELSDLRQVGVEAASVEELVLRRARLAQEAGLDGVVASPREVRTLRAALSPGFLLVIPGVRAAASAVAAVDDQKRTGSARQAIADGADFLVVGRPVRDAADPRKAVAELLEEMGQA